MSATLSPARARRGRRLGPWLRGIAITVVTLVFALPVVWMFAAAFKTNVQVTDPSVGLWFTPTLDNFRAVVEAGQIVRSMGNSLLVG
ncbi:carbohydrate ABC transporter permease, partial [Streptomyces sp. SID7982]|nr:carbohydrate ABC transporter permease [Streptomyces sp. SID7982]